jgi:hypothetical protein
MLAAAQQKSPRPSKPERRPAHDVVDFLSFASMFKGAVKPVRFAGEHWKL